MLPGIRAQARIDSPQAYARLVKAMKNEDDRIATPAAVQILRLAGVSFASDAEETKAQAEAQRTVTPQELAEALGHPALPLN